MIHQLTFVAPWPGTSEVVSRRRGVRTPESWPPGDNRRVGRHLVGTRLPVCDRGREPAWGGLVEAWLAEEPDPPPTPRAYRATPGVGAAGAGRALVLDTDPHELLEGDDLPARPADVKLVVLVKRRSGLPLERFREHSLGDHGELALEIPGLRRYVQGLTHDSAYRAGEPVLDAVYQLWFDDVAALARAAASAEFARAEADLRSVAAPGYPQHMVVREHRAVVPTTGGPATVDTDNDRRPDAQDLPYLRRTPQRRSGP